MTRTSRKITYQGSLTDQFRKIAANPSSMTSVTIEEPFLNSSPPKAGRRANAKGAECHAEDSCSVPWPNGSGVGSKRSSVESANDLRESLKEYSEKFELLRLVDVAPLDAVLCLNAGSSPENTLRCNPGDGEVGLVAKDDSSAIVARRR